LWPLKFVVICGCIARICLRPALWGMPKKQGWIMHEAGEAEALGPGPDRGLARPLQRKFTK